MSRTLAVLATLVVAGPAAGQLRIVPEQPSSAAAARAGVDVFLINDSDSVVTIPEPRSVSVVTADGARLTLVPAEDAPATIAARGFARLRYRSDEVAVTDARTLSTPPPAIPKPRPTEIRAISSAGAAEAFVERFEPYQPTYGVAGLDDAGAKLQVSFAFRPFGGDGALSHLRLAYTQTMFWALDQPSGPFRATTYSPEAFYEMPVGRDLRIALGFRHDSNGEGDPTSIDVNRLYLRAAQGFDLGSGWRAEIVPQTWIYVGRRGYTRDVNDYLGHTALKASIAQDDGLKLSITARGSIETGRGAAELFASYPLTRLGGLGLYLFGQAFTGYGEAIDDYRVHDRHARLGIALTR